MPGAPSRRCGKLPPRGAPDVFPLAVSGNNRYLVDAQGTPFFPAGESAWMLLTLSIADLTVYLDECVSKGINALRTNGPIRWAGSARANANGDFAFTTPTDFTTSFVPAYWSDYKTRLGMMRTRGMVAFIEPLYQGFNGDSSGEWGPICAGKTLQQIEDYCAALATELVGYDNIIWSCYGDATPPNANRITAIVDGLRSVSPARLCTAQYQRPTPSSSVQPTSGNWDIEGVYAEQAAHAKTLDSYALNVGPCWLQEPYYEQRVTPTITDRQCRAQMWSTLCSGSAGYSYGHEQICYFDLKSLSQGGAGAADYETFFNDVVRTSFGLYNAFVATIQWWRLVPDTGSALVTAGRGTVSAENYVAAAKSASPQDLGLVYIPDGGAITVALGGFPGPVTVEWVDPTTSAVTAASGSPFAASGSQVFTASSEKGNNAGGDPDWVLRLRV